MQCVENIVFLSLLQTTVYTYVFFLVIYISFEKSKHSSRVQSYAFKIPCSVIHPAASSFMLSLTFFLNPFKSPVLILLLLL